MRWQRWLVCGVIVMAAHGALFEALGGHALMVREGEAHLAGSPSVARLVMMSRDEAATASFAAAAASAASEPAAPASVPIEVATADMPPAAPSPAPAQAEDGHAGTTAHDGGTSSVRRATVIYRSPAALDEPIRPRSAPDLSMLEGLAWSGVPVRLRLFIDSQGTVVDTEVLQSADADEVLARVRAMFLATGFTSGTVAGQPVPSYKDIEITIGAPP
jgi:hypothetical protein